MLICIEICTCYYIHKYVQIYVHVQCLIQVHLKQQSEPALQINVGGRMGGQSNEFDFSLKVLK